MAGRGSVRDAGPGAAGGAGEVAGGAAGRSAGSQYRLSLSLGFGAVVLVLTLSVVLAADRLFQDLRQSEEKRLSEALAMVIGESVSRVSFSGKYQSRLLVEELGKLLPAGSYISVESVEGLILAHSDPALDDKPVSLEEFSRSKESLARGSPVVVEKSTPTTRVREIVTPYFGGLSQSVLGVVRVGVDVKGASAGQSRTRTTLVAFGAVLALAGILVVHLLSRVFGRTVSSLAEELEGILAHAPMPIWIGGPDGSIQASSAEAARLVADHGGIPGCVPSPFAGVVAEAAESGGGVERDIVSLHLGEARAWHASVFPIALGRDGKGELLCGFLRDTTVETRSQEEVRKLNARLEARILERTEALERANEELSRTNAALEQSLARLGDAQQMIIRSEKLSALGQLSAGVAHDLNTPLGAIVSSSSSLVELLGAGLGSLAPFLRGLSAGEEEAFTRLLELAFSHAQEALSTTTRAERRAIESRLEGAGIAEPEHVAEIVADAGLARDLDEVLACLALARGREVLAAVLEFATARRLIAVIDTAAGRAARVVSALKSYLRRDSENLVEAIRPSDGIETVLVLYHNRIKYGVALETRYLTGDLAFGNTNLLSQVWINLIDNALQAMDYKGRLSITVERAKEDIVVTIEDDGPGIPAEIQDRVFEPFFTTKKQGEGLGLGLDICRSVVESMGGGIRFESRPGRTAFHVRLRAASGR